MANFLKSVTDATITIPRNSSSNGVTYFDIEVVIGSIVWTVKRRYREFVELNEKLISEQSISRDLLPPKKVIGNRSPTFLEQRQHSLEKYLQYILRFLQLAMCREFVEFLDFNKYDIIYLLQDLAEIFYNQGERILAQDKVYGFSALELHAISERLRLPCPLAAGSVRKVYDFSHVVDFCSQIENVVVGPLKLVSNREQNVSMTIEQYLAIGTSNLIPKNLKFDLNAFRNIKSLQIYGLTTENICDAELLRENVTELIIQHSGVQQINSILLCDCIHRAADQLDKTKSWHKLESVNFSANSLQSIDTSIKLIPKMKTLNLNKNQIRTITNLNCLPYLNSLSLCENRLADCVDCHLEVGNLTSLNLAQNQIKSLRGFRRMYSLVMLNLSCNLIVDIIEVDHIAGLPCLEELILTGNPLAASVDYRPRVLSRFGDRCEEILLDNEKGGPIEIDTALVLAALRKSEVSPTFLAKGKR